MLVIPARRFSTAEGLVKLGSSACRPLNTKTLDSCLRRNDKQAADQSEHPWQPIHSSRHRFAAPLSPGTGPHNGPTETIMHRWYTRPVLFVSDVDRALYFYTGMLGFKKAWHEGDGKGKVCQVDRAGSEIILCEDAGRRDKGRLFVELTREGLAAFRREIAERSIPNRESWWGCDVIRIDDPDGNELLFPLSDGDGATGDAA